MNNILSPNIVAWITAGWLLEISESAGTFTARLYTGVTVPHTKSAGAAADAALALANSVPLTVTPPPP